MNTESPAEQNSEKGPTERMAELFASGQQEQRLAESARALAVAHPELKEDSNFLWGLVKGGALRAAVEMMPNEFLNEQDPKNMDLWRGMVLAGSQAGRYNIDDIRDAVASEKAIRNIQ